MDWQQRIKRLLGALVKDVRQGVVRGFPVSVG